MIKWPSKSDNQEIDRLRQRAKECDEYHISFDELLREHHSHIVAAASPADTAAAIDTLFHNLDQARHLTILRELYDGLSSEGKLKLIAKLLKDQAIKDTLKEFAEAETEYDRVIMEIFAEAKRFDYIRPAHIPADARVRILLRSWRDTDGKTREAIRALRYSYSVELRALGDNRFKVLRTIYHRGSGVNYFSDGARIRFGTVIGTADHTKLEERCHFLEKLGLQGSDLAVPHHDLVVVRIRIDDTIVLPQ